MHTQSRAIILARVSGKAQEDGYSLDSQAKLLRDYCKNRGLEVVREFRIIESASRQEQRPPFQSAR